MAPVPQHSDGVGDQVELLEPMMGAIGFMGALASLVVLVSHEPPPSSLASFALISEVMAAIAVWVVLPSFVLTLVSGLLAIAVNRAFHNAGCRRESGLPHRP
jgi:hypothetical protein